MLCPIIILMEQKDTKHTQSFLDKFKGRANRIDKTGLTNALDPIKSPLSQKQIQPASQRRLPSLQRRHNHQTSHIDRLDSSQLNSSRAEGIAKGQAHQFKPIGSAKINNNKADLLPPIHSPRTPHTQNTTMLPPSRPISDRSESLQRRIFGKYLKLDEEATKHLEYLRQMDKERAKRKASLSQRS